MPTKAPAAGESPQPARSIQLSADDRRRLTSAHAALAAATAAAKQAVADADYLLGAVLAEMGGRLAFDWRQPVTIEDDGTLTVQPCAPEAPTS